MPVHDDDVAELPNPPWRLARERLARRHLSAAIIVQTALWVMDAEGLDAVSMRRVAQELGTGAASLYQHVRNKRELHELMLDEVFGDVALPEADPARWREQLKAAMLAMAAKMREHPGIARISLETLIPTTPGMLVTMDAMMGLLRAGGVPERYIPAACDALALYVTAYAYEASLWPGDGHSEAGRRLADIRAYLASLPSERLPHLVALQAKQGNNDEHFEFALDVFIAGLASYVES